MACRENGMQNLQEKRRGKELWGEADDWNVVDYRKFNYIRFNYIRGFKAKAMVRGLGQIEASTI
eukprot:3067226-Pleurochrysis_carterae.AAC.1